MAPALHTVRLKNPPCTPDAHPAFHGRVPRRTNRLSGRGPTDTTSYRPPCPDPLTASARLSSSVPPPLPLPPPPRLVLLVYIDSCHRFDSRAGCPCDSSCRRIARPPPRTRAPWLRWRRGLMVLLLLPATARRAAVHPRHLAGLKGAIIAGGAIQH